MSDGRGDRRVLTIRLRGEDRIHRSAEETVRRLAPRLRGEGRFAQSKQPYELHGSTPDCAGGLCIVGRSSTPAAHPPWRGGRKG